MSFYNFKNKFSFNYKQAFLKRINFCKENQYQHFKINSLNEISYLQILFCQQVPIYSNGTNTNGELNSIDQILKSILIDGNGGTPSHLNIVFGLFLFELGIHVQLINIKNLVTSNYEYSNLINWCGNGNYYLVDVGMGLYSCFQPIELGSTGTVTFNNKDYRIRKLRDSSFIYEEKYSNFSIYQPICHFNNKTIVKFDEVFNNNKINNNNNNYNDNNNNNNGSYNGNATTTTKDFALFKLFDKGYYLYENDNFYMVYFNNTKKDKELKLSIDKDLVNKYFNIKI